MLLGDLIGLIVFIAIGVGTPAYFMYRFYQDKKIHWQKLAKDNGLKYTRSKWFKGGNFVSGNFRGYHLKLESVGERIGDEDGYTYIVLTPHKSQTDRLATLSKSTSVIKKTLGIFESSPKLRGKIKGGKYPQIVHYEQNGIESDVKYLQSVFDLLGDIADAYLLAMILEGKALPSLQEAVQGKNNPLRSVIHQLLDDIFQKISTRLNDKNTHLVCQNCLTNYDIHKIGVWWSESFKYYGCRVCHKSQNCFEVQKVVAFLDTEVEEVIFQQKGTLCINWLVERKLFDFDEVRIFKATDEDVERFAVQIGNDTDEVRKPTYQKMQCLISIDCGLSENTLRILRRMFGVVEVKEFLTEPIRICRQKAT